MSENQVPTRFEDETGVGSTVDHPAGELRMQSGVTFGIRAAALASLVVPVGLVAGGFASGGRAMQAVTMTTCCPTLPM